MKIVTISWSILFFVLFISISYSETKNSLSVLEEIKALGTYSEPTKYPEGMIKLFGEECKKKFICMAPKATKEMSLTFKKNQIYHQRKPGDQLYALAMFELFYLNKLKKKEKRIKKFIESWPEKKKYKKDIVALIKLNKSKEKMRKSLGMDLSVTPEEAMERYWVMGDFLNRGKINEDKINKDIQKREKLIAKYKKAINKFNSSLKDKENKDLYNKIKER